MDQRLAPFAGAIGEMCNEWAHLEGWIGRLFLAVGEWDYRLKNALIMISCIDIRDQIKATKIGAINRCPPGDFSDRVVASLDYIDDGLRTARNRFVHDIWSPAKDDRNAIKATLTPRAIKSPGTGIREVQAWESQYVSIDEIREVITDIINEQQYVARILECFQNPGDHTLPMRLAELPPRLHLLRQQEKQRQRGISIARRKSQPKA
jgi:hypothetical protein